MARIFFAKEELPERAGDTHFMVVGATGAGKSLFFKLLMNSVVPSFFQKNARGGYPDRRAVIFDEKQDIYSFLRSMKVPPEKIYLLNPFDRRCHAWNMAEDITGPDTALQVAAIFIPEEPGSSNRYFSDSARAILTGVLRVFIKQGGKTGAAPAWGLSDVLAVMRNPDTVRHVLNHTEDGKDLVALHLQPGKTSNDILSTAGAFLAPFEVVGALWKKAQTAGRVISLRRFLSENALLVLGNNQDARAPIEAINRLVFQRLTQLVLALSENEGKESEKRRIWFFLDELRKLGRLPGLDDLMNNGRSKGASITIGFQDIQGLRAVYGPEVADELISMCASFAVLRLAGVATPKWAAELFGEQRGREVMKGENVQNSMDGRMAVTDTGGEHSFQRTLYFDSTFKQIPITTPRTGLTGYYFSPYIEDEKGQLNPFKEKFTWREIEERFPQEIPEERALREERQRAGEEDAANFCPWENEEVKYLQRLSNEDCSRLNLRKLPSSDDSKNSGELDALPPTQWPTRGSTYEEGMSQIRASAREDR